MRGRTETNKRERGERGRNKQRKKKRGHGELDVRTKS